MNIFFLISRIWTPGMKYLASAVRDVTSKHRIFNYPVCMVSIGVLSQLLESHSHLIMLPGESLISSHIQLRLQALQQFSPCTGTSQSASVMRSPQHTTAPWLRSEVTNITKPNPAKQGILSRLASVSAAVDSIHLSHTEKQKKQFSLLLCFHHCYFCGKSPPHNTLDLGAWSLVDRSTYLFS